VPYVPQSEALCGGAAAAMVLRYWGVHGVTAETFASLVDPKRDGIPTRALTQTLVDRGWLAMPFAGDAALVRHHLARGRPVIALVEAGPRRYHYVVIVRWTDAEVRVHDPAVGPDQHLAPARFDSAWERTGRWTLLLLPDAEHARPPDAPTHTDTLVAPAACAPALARAAAAAAAGRYPEAEHELASARAQCPHDGSPERELAGLRLLQGRSRDAAALARSALAKEPADRQAVRVLATAEFLSEQPVDALRTWNTLAEPHTDLVALRGLTRTRTPVGLAALGLEPGEVLQPGALDRARRRLESVPAVRVARVDYVPVPGGLANVDAAAVESLLLPSGPGALAAVGLGAVVDREMRVDVASPTGSGERVSASWRWWENRPRVRLAAAVPLQRGPVRGVLTLEGLVESQSYGLDQSRAPIRTTRRSASVAVADWTHTGLRWQIQAGLDRWRDGHTGARMGGSLEQRAWRDRLSLTGAVDVWPGSDLFSVATLDLQAQSSVGLGNGLAAGVTAVTASTRAPLDLWPGAGTGQGRPLLLRAHPLLDGGVIRGETFGRTLIQSTLEGRRHLAGIGPVRLTGALFVDAARAWDGPLARRLLADVGVGLRVRVPGEGTLRLDLARSVTDGSHAISAGWDLWPRRH
jgi:hypothetical protein